MSELREAQPGACGGRRQAALRPMPSLAAWIVDAGDQDYAEVVEKAGVPVLVDLWATWCGPCRMVSPALEKLATERAGQLKLVKVDVDKRRPPRNGSRYKRCRRCSSSTAARRWPVNPGPHPLRRCGLGWISLGRTQLEGGVNMTSTGLDPDVVAINSVTPRTTGCEECLRLGTPWVHLRLCLTCGHVAAAIRHPCATREDTRTPSAIRSWRPWRQIGAGAMSTRIMSEALRPSRSRRPWRKPRTSTARTRG